MITPTADEIRSSFDARTPIVCGWPAHVALDNGVASLDLVGTERTGRPQWHTRRWIYDGVLELCSPDDRTLYVGEMDVGGNDVGLVDAAIAAAPTDIERHSATAETKRKQAAAYVMRIGDAMVRARLLDALEAWEAILGKVIDEDKDHGKLCLSSDETIEAKCLRVVCPSTGRAYVHLVPREMETAKQARLWVMNVDEVPEVET